MLKVFKDKTFAGVQMPFGTLEVEYPPQAKWDLAAFEQLKEQELALVRAQGEGYDRKRDFSEEPYFRYFRRFKKTYPVMAQLESFLLKGRPFPQWSPINQVAFLTELKTRMLTGTHDVDQIYGPLVLFLAAEEAPFTGMGGRDCHSYAGDLTGRDDQGIILSMIAGPDDRTCLSDNTLHPVYMVFSPPGTSDDEVVQCLDQMARYVQTLAPGAGMHRSVC